MLHSENSIVSILDVWYSVIHCSLVNLRPVLSFKKYGKLQTIFVRVFRFWGHLLFTYLQKNFNQGKHIKYDPKTIKPMQKSTYSGMPKSELIRISDRPNLFGWKIIWISKTSEIWTKSFGFGCFFCLKSKLYWFERSDFGHFF